MTTQPEPLRLADKLESCSLHVGDPEQAQAAAELRRLHTLCGEWEKKAATWLASPQAAQRLDGYRELAQRLNAAEAVNQELLEALRTALINTDALEISHCKDAAAIRAAIAKAEGQV
jgi:hypothetical protein